MLVKINIQKGNNTISRHLLNCFLLMFSEQAYGFRVLWPVETISALTIFFPIQMVWGVLESLCIPWQLIGVNFYAMTGLAEDKDRLWDLSI